MLLRGHFERDIRNLNSIHNEAGAECESPTVLKEKGIFIKGILGQFDALVDITTNLDARSVFSERPRSERARTKKIALGELTSRTAINLDWKWKPHVRFTFRVSQLKVRSGTPGDTHRAINKERVGAERCRRVRVHSRGTRRSLSVHQKSIPSFRVPTRIRRSTTARARARQINRRTATVHAATVSRRIRRRTCILR